jgi:hypothetical protein
MPLVRNNVPCTVKPFGFFRRVQSFVIGGIARWADYRMSPVDFEISLNRIIFEKQIDLLKCEISKRKSNLKYRNACGLMQKLASNSLKVFQAYLYEEYGSKASKDPRKKFENPWQEPDSFRKEYPIITSTTNAARNQTR